jgi:ABC-type transporter Mla subunit MlaD
MSIITSKTNKATALAKVQALVAGTEKHFPNGSFTLGKTTYTTASLIAALQSLENAMTAVNAAQAQAKDAVLALRNVEATTAPLLRDFKRFLLATFSTSVHDLSDFGLEPPKAPKPLSTEKRAAATAKMKATRAARGTTSKKQKLAVKGNVTGVVVTPVTTAPASPHAASPAAPPETTANSPVVSPAPAPAPAPSGAAK